MSEAAKPSDPTPAAAVAAGTESAAPPVSANAESTPTSKDVTGSPETGVDATEPPADNSKTEVESKPASEGVLGYKSPGLIQ